LIVYLHGFNSSPQSHKALLLQRYMTERGLGREFSCPALPHQPRDAVRLIRSLVGEKPVCYLGSSLGGFYATYLVETQGGRAVLVNPAIDPHIGLSAYLGPQKNLYTGEPYELTSAHLDQLRELDVPRVTPQHYLLLVEKGDEVLDYRRAVERYAGAAQLIIEGGDHSLRSFPEHLPKILRFAGY
jgi:predicted esterase YcpF (UPF0227 family)